MADAVEEFFDDLKERDHEPQLAKASGTMRFDVSDGKRTAHWLLTFDRGNVTVSRRRAAADLVVRSERALFEQIVQGKANAMAALLRGAISFDGSSQLLVLFQRLLPRPRDARTMDVAAGYARRQR